MSRFPVHGSLIRRALAAAAVLAVLVPATAHASWPGGNGMIAFVCGGICVVNADQGRDLRAVVRP